MERFLYFNAAADDAVTLPLSALKSMNHNGSNTVVFEFLTDSVNGNTAITITTAADKEKEFMDDVSRNIASSRDPFIVVADDEDQRYISSNVGTSGSVVSAIGRDVGPRTKVQNLTDATKSILGSESGTLFRLNRAGGIVATLPVAQVGLTYDFVIETTFTGTFSLDAASANDIFTAGSTVIISDKDAPGTVSLKQFHADGSDDDQMVLDGDDNGRHVGGTFTCTGVAAGGQGSATAVWSLNGVLFGDGTLATPFA
tara:strand:- start:79 stop:846 length:768 start_codon:yes stop_codon:yes gene_type:complete